MSKIRLLLLCSLLFLVACAKKADIESPVIYTDADAQNRWTLVQAKSSNSTPFLVEGSLRFGHENEKKRTSFLFWGNENGPYRFDIIAVGSPVAQFYKDDERVEFYLNKENKIYYQKNLQDAFKAFDIKMPLDFNALMMFSQGIFPVLNTPDYLKAFTQENGIFRYVLSSDQTKYYGFYDLDDLLRVRSWQFEDWQVNFEYDDESTKPKKVSGLQENGFEFTLFIRENVAKDMYQKQDMQLAIPSNAVKINNYR